VLPYFQRAECRVGSNAGRVYGTSGPQFISELRDPNPTTAAFLAACAELGLRRLGELNEPDNTGYAPTPVTQRRGLRHSAEPQVGAAASVHHFRRHLVRDHLVAVSVRLGFVARCDMPLAAGRRQ